MCMGDKEIQSKETTTLENHTQTDLVILGQRQADYGISPQLVKQYFLEFGYEPMDHLDAYTSIVRFAGWLSMIQYVPSDEFPNLIRYKLMGDALLRELSEDITDRIKDDIALINSRLKHDLKQRIARKYFMESGILQAIVDELLKQFGFKR